MLLNGHYIDHIFKWTKKAGFSINESKPSKFISIKEFKEADVDHKLTFMVKNRQTAEELGELFGNASYNVVSVQDFYVDEYNGIYNLIKGNISADGGKREFTGTLWLQNRSDIVRDSHYKEDFDNDFKVLQDETDEKPTINPLAIGTGGTPTWTNDSGYFSCTADAGDNFYLFGYNWWNSVIIETDIKLTSLSNEYVGLMINFVDISNYYRIYIGTTEGYIELQKRVDGTYTIIASTTDIGAYDTDTQYNVKCIYSAGRFDVFLQNKHIFTVYDYDILSGQVGVYDDHTDNQFSNLKVTQYIPPVINTSAGFNEYAHPKLNRNIWTKDGTLQSYVNFEEEPINKTYPSRLNDGDVKIWDVMDNDFSQTYVDPQPLKWQRVYDISHEFKGHMFVENGLFGILYTNVGIYHYVYDQPYRKGQKVWLDFKQNPNYDVWNESYEHRKFLSENQGIGNWNEDGLDFEPIYNTNGKDRIYHNTHIPEYTSALFNLIDSGIKVKFNKHPRTNPAGYTTPLMAGHLQNGSNIVHSLRYHENNLYLSGASYDGSVNNQVDIDAPLNTDLEIEFKSFKNFIDGHLGYTNGLLTNQKLDHTSIIESESKFSVGETYSGTWNDPIPSRIDEVTNRILNKGKTVTRQLKTPLVWHSFDEKDWDNTTRVFVDKGSAGVDLSLSSTPLLKKDGRYNQCIYVDDSDNSFLATSSLTTELDNLTEFTVEFWMKYVDTVANYHNIVRLKSGTFDTFNIFLDATFLAMTVEDSVGSGQSVIIAHTSSDFDTDQKWHHFAFTYDGSTSGKIYIDGVEVAEASITKTPNPVPDTLTVGDGEFDAWIDELIISDYAKQPHEFGVIIPDAYETGQWYNNYEFDQDEHGVYHRNSNPAAFFEMSGLDGTLVDRVSNNTINIVARGDQSKVPAKCGLGLGGGTSTSSITSSYTRILNQDFTKDRTIQFYYTPNDISISTTLMRFIFDTNSMYFAQRDTGKLLLGSTYGDAVLEVGTMYHIAIIFKKINDLLYFDVYVNGVIDIPDVLNAYQDNNINHIMYIAGSGFSVLQGNIGNLTMHDGIIPPSKFGIFVDTEPLPKLYAEIKRYKEAVYLFASGYTLKSISPSIVEIDVVDPYTKRIIPSWIESGDYFYKMDCIKNNIGASGSAYDSIYYYFPVQSNAARFTMMLGDTIEFKDYSILRANQEFNAPANSDNTLYAFDFNESNVVFITSNSKSWSGLAYAVDIHSVHGSAKASMIYNIYTGIKSFGFVPQRAVNEMFWDMTEGRDNIEGLVNDTTNWYLSGSVTISYSKLCGLDVYSNYKRFPKGLYLIISRARLSSGGTTIANAVYNDDGAGYGYVMLSEDNNTAFAYNYGMFNVTEPYSLADMDIYTYKNTADTGITWYFDYVVIIPLSNGHDFPLDLIRRSLTKTTKQKVLE